MFLKKLFIFDSPPSFAIFSFNLLILICLGVPLFLLFLSDHPFNLRIIIDYRSAFFKGWLITIAISFASFFASSAIGLLTAFGLRCKVALIRYICRAYIEFIRGTPLLVQILFFFYVVAHALHFNNRYMVGILTLSVFSGAYLAEIFRSGIESVGQSQLESAKAIGLNKIQTYRFVILPQAFRVTLPPLSGQFASLIKDSSLLSIIGINELTYMSQQVNSATYSTLESFIPLGLGYLLLTLPISIWSRFLERKYLYET